MKRRAFTLIEIIIAIAILGLLSTFTLTQVAKLVKTHQFDKEVSELFIRLQEAQVLATTFQTDIELDISCKKGAFSYIFTTDEPFKKHQFESKECPLPHASLIQFNKSKPGKSSLHFHIYPQGRIEPRGVLIIESSTKTLWIDLQYGFMMKYSNKQPVVINQSTQPKKPKI